MHKLRFELRPADESIAQHWSQLASLGSANAFMSPTALTVVQQTGFSPIRVLLAWRQAERAERLVGIWALRESRHSVLMPPVLSAPPYDYAFLSNPAVDPDHAEEIVSGFLDVIESDRNLPKLLQLRSLDADAASFPAMLSALANRGARTVALAVRARPFITATSGSKRSGSTRKKLRNHWNRLCSAGHVEVRNDRSSEQVGQAFETFLGMEAASWKGRRGTAFLCRPEDALFSRQLIAAMAAHGEASVALLTIDGRAIAAQVLLYCGPVAYTWKTAFDAEHGDFSPGAVLVDKLAEQLLAQPGIDAIESCSSEGGFMSSLWDGRRVSLDCAVELGAGRPLAFATLSAKEQFRAGLRGLRSKLTGADRPTRVSSDVRANWEAGVRSGAGRRRAVPLTPPADHSNGGVQPNSLGK